MPPPQAVYDAYYSGISTWAILSVIRNENNQVRPDRRITAEELGRALVDFQQLIRRHEPSGGPQVSRADWEKLVNDPDKPLLNKAIQAQLAPGSTFKILMATAGWQEGIAQTLHVFCTGGAEFYGRRFGC